MPRFVAGMLSVGLIVLGASPVFGQPYPNKPIRMVTYEAGGSGDTVARLIAQELSAALGQQVIIDNRGGAGGAIAIETVAKAPPDGYTLLHYGNGLWLLPLLRDNMPWDPVRDFLPITLTHRSAIILVVNPSLAAKSVNELIALAKARPGALNYGSSGAGSTGHLAGELFKAMAGVNMVHIAYKGTAQALTAVVGGEIQLEFASVAATAPHIKAGRLRALAVTSAQPSALAPDLPTVAATLPGFESAGMTGMFAPAKTPAAIINRLNQELVQVLNRADVKEKVFNAGAEIGGNSPQQFAAAIKSEMGRLGKVIKDAGIRVE